MFPMMVSSGFSTVLQVVVYLQESHPRRRQHNCRHRVGKIRFEQLKCQVFCRSKLYILGRSSLEQRRPKAHNKSARCRNSSDLTSVNCSKCWYLRSIIGVKLAEHQSLLAKWPWVRGVEMHRAHPLPVCWFLRDLMISHGIHCIPWQRLTSVRSCPRIS